MNEVYMLSVILYTVVFMAFIANLQFFNRESNKLVQEGKTPLPFHNILVILVATLAQLITVRLLVLLLESLHTDLTVWWVISSIFAFSFYVIHIVAYLVTWGIWGTYFFIEKRKTENKDEDELRRKK